MIETVGFSHRYDIVRRAAGAVLTVLLLVVAVLFFVRAPETALSEGRTRSDPPQGSPGSTADRATPSVGGSVGTSDGGSASSAGTTPPATSSAEPSATTPGGATTSGPGRSAAGIQLIGQPRSDGSWDVIEYVRPSTPSGTLRLSLPSVAVLGGQFTGQTAGAASLQATADDQVATIKGQGARWQVDTAVPAQQFVLRYVLTGATVRSVPSKAGRALTALGPIANPGDQSVLVQLITVGATVRTVQCPLLSGDQQLCQAGSPPKIRVAQPLPRRTALALVQFDLPDPQ